MANKDQYFPLWWGDFLRSTSDWTGPERGLYLQLLASQWGSGSLRSEPDKLALAMGYPLDEFMRLWETVRHKFVNGAGKLRNVRLEEHRQNLQDFQTEQRRKSGLGVAKRRQMGQLPGEPGVKPEKNPPGSTRGSSPGEPGENPPLHSTPLHTNPSPDTSPGNGTDVGAKKGSQARPPPRKRCPPDFQITPALREWAARVTPNVELDAETVTFKDHEFHNGKTDWEATWRNWMTREQKEINKRRGKFGKPTAHPMITSADIEMREVRRKTALGMPADAIARELEMPLARVNKIIADTPKVATHGK